VAYALFRALELVSKALVHPYQDWQITVEPRTQDPEAVSRWDVRVSPPLEVVECKLRPSREDLIEWLRRVGQSGNLDPQTRFLLVYGMAGGTLLSSITALRRLAVEAGDDQDLFQALATREGVRDAAEIIDCLGSHHVAYLRRMELQNIPEEVLRGDNDIRARSLCGEQAPALINELDKRLREALRNRRTHDIRQIVSELTASGIRFVVPAEVRLADLGYEAAASLVLLQTCRSGLPTEVLAEATGCEVAALTSRLDVLITSRTIAFEKDRWRLAVPSHPWATVNMGDTLSRGLAALVNYVSRNEDVAAGRSLVLDVVALARRCFEAEPKSIVGIFRRMEKLLKRIGNKHLVLEMAELTIAAAKRPPCDIEDAKARAHALICGRSWVFQRLGHLEEARLVAKESLQLGADIGYQRNTAFCMKCTGRILRLQAEKERDRDLRAALLTESASVIDAAIEEFKVVPEIGPTHPEVGDSFSLLARTYLVAKRYDMAQSALQRAYSLIPPNGSKDHLDLLILTGDLMAETGQRDGAETSYTEALTLPEAADVQRSEILARAYYQRGANREKLKRSDVAAADYGAAAEIWESLEEYEFAAKARWAGLRLGAGEDEQVLRELETEDSYLVRLLAFRFYREQYNASAGVVLSRRRQPSPEQLSQLLKRARMEVAVRYPRW
jgi:tetratricopeptide (TPR) repeat protein